MARIALVHAGAVSIPPIELAFQQLWPEAQIMNLLDDSLFLDRGAGALPPAMTERFVTLGRYAAASGADGILFTCSAFAPASKPALRIWRPFQYSSPMKP